MTGFPLAAVAAIALLLGVVYFVRKSSWIVVYEGSELTEQASDQYGLLQENGVRVRMRSVPLRRGAGAGFAADAAADPSELRTVVEIHKDDLPKAKELLQQEVGGRYEFNF
ncbi:hypothetical protein MO973_15180 [Paenibacillus sp. TRM 82003]|nr:hypothetical protein [Paenibacillus sp. TRM 82003]